MPAAWDDFRFGLKHDSHFGRVAMVGDKTWEEWMVRFCRPFPGVAVMNFNVSESDLAWVWLREKNLSDPQQMKKEKYVS